MPLDTLLLQTLLFGRFILTYAATWILPAIIVAISSALATALAIPTLTRHDTFAIARSWFVGLAAGTFAGFAVYVILSYAAVALIILGAAPSYPTRLFLGVILTAISLAAGGAFGGWISAKLFISRLLNARTRNSDAA